MARLCKPLTDTYIKNIKEVGPKKHNDGNGLYLFVSPTGGKLWRMAYKFNGKPKTASFGPYPLVSLQQARKKRDELAALVFQNINPKSAVEENHVSQLSFQEVAEEWFNKNEPGWKYSHSRNIRTRLLKHIYPYIGDRPIRDIKANELIVVLNKLESQGIIETAHIVSQYFTQIYRYAVILGYAEYNVADNLRGALSKRKRKHFASLTDVRDVGGLLRAIEE